MINGERIKRRGWSFLGIPEDQTSLHPTITSPRRIAEKNQETARLRFLRARRMATQDDDEGAWGEDSFVAEPSDDESIPPDHPEFPLTQLRSCSSDHSDDIPPDHSDHIRCPLRSWIRA